MIYRKDPHEWRVWDTILVVLSTAVAVLFVIWAVNWGVESCLHQFPKGSHPL